MISLLGWAGIRLTPVALEALSHKFSWYHFVALIGNITFMAYSEGYRGFQKSFTPKMVARMKYLQMNANWFDTILAPLFCMGYYGTLRKKQLVTFILTAVIVLLIIFVRHLEQPWRGIIDAGVVVGLSWGIVSIIIMVLKAFVINSFEVSTEVTE